VTLRRGCWCLVLLALLASCRRSASEGFSLRVAVTGKLVPVTPDEVENWSGIAGFLIFEPLLYLTSSGKANPVLAERIQSLPPKGIRVWLRAGSTFSNGERVTLQDVARSLQGHALKATVEQDSVLIESDDLATPVEIQLSRINIYRRVGDQVLGTGGFMLVEQDAQHILLHRRSPSPDHVETVSLRSFDTPQEAFVRSLKGDVDALPRIEPHWVEILEGIPRLQTIRLLSPFANAVLFNPVRLSRKERLDLAKLLRTKQIRTLAFGDECSPTENEETNKPSPEPAGRKLDVLTIPLLERFGLAISRGLGDQGGTVRVEEATEVRRLMDAREFDLAAFRMLLSPSSAAALRWRTGAADNYFRYSNPRLDAALDARDWAAAQRELADDPPFAVICEAAATTAIDSRITNVSTTRFWANLVNWEVRQ
jgi:hypothetical protein